jgi:putative methylase
LPLQISKKQLEIQLSQLKIPNNPKLLLEQYPISAEVAAELLHMASFEYQDLYGKNIIDLGTGTGLLAIGSVLLGAQHVTGVDVDPDALQE